MPTIKKFAVTTFNTTLFQRPLQVLYGHKSDPSAKVIPKPNLKVYNVKTEAADQSAENRRKECH